MRIDELFHKTKVPWNWSYTSAREAEADFVIGDIQYKFYAYTSGGEQPAWDIEFKVVEGGDPKNRFGVTGTGNAALVMSTVVDILRNFLQMYQGQFEELTFTADEPSRQKLYAKMVRRLLPTWKFQHHGKEFSLTSPDYS